MGFTITVHVDSASIGKQGCCPEMCVDLGHYVEEECPHLNLCGLMTIGRQCQTVTPNPDFMVCTVIAPVSCGLFVSNIHFISSSFRNCYNVVNVYVSR